MSLTRRSLCLHRADASTAAAVLIASALSGCGTSDQPDVELTASPLAFFPMQRTFTGDAQGADTCRAIAARSDDSFVVTGDLSRITQGHNVVTRSYDSGGNLLWNREINTPSEGHDSGNDVITLADGSAVTAGFWFAGSSGYNFFLNKLTLTGSQTWRREGTDAAHDKYMGVATDLAGNLYVAGVKPDASGGGQAWVRKLGADGNTLLWEDVRTGTSPNAPNAASKVGVDVFGNTYVVGYLDNTATGTGRDGYISKYSASGGLLAHTWVWTYGPDEVSDVAVAADGSLAVTAKLDTSGSVRKYSASGALLWKTSDPPIIWRGVTMDGSGKVYATGSQGSTMITRQFAAADGAILWTETQANAAGEGVALDGSGRTLVCGSTAAADGATDGLIMRYPF